MAPERGRPARPRPPDDERPGRAAGRPGHDALLLIDVRRFTQAFVRPFLTTVIDELVAMGARDELVIVCDYEPSGLAYQLDLRPQTRGMFHYECVQRSDGAWVETISRL